MNELLQPGLHPDPHLHPDPDALNAFAEGSLTAQERTPMLMHLADCAHCREIVFLAQDAALQAAPEPAAVSFWRRHRKSITLIGAALGLPALAGLALIFVTLRPHPTNAPSVALRESPTMPPPAPTPSTKATSATPPTPAALSASALKGTGFIPHESDNRSKAGLASERAARPLAKIEPLKPSVEPRPLGFMGTGAGRAPTVGMAAPVRSMSSLHADAVPQITVQNRALGGVAAMPAPQPGTSVPRATAVNLGNGLPAGAPAPVVSNRATDSLTAPPAAAQTVTVQGAEALSMDSASVSNSVPYMAAVKQRALAPTAPPLPLSELPSKLPTTWLVSSGARSLATDTAGSLFLSLDAGRHWQPVAAAWPGRVAQLRLAPAPSVFQLLTTTGAVWLSADGLHWQPQ